MWPWSGPAEVVALPSGAASGGISYPLPGGEVTAIEALAFTLVCGAGVANRQVVASLEDGTGATVYAVAAPAVQAANSTVVYSFAPLVPSFGTAALGFMGGPFPGVRYADNMTLVVHVAAAQAGDSIVGGRLLVKQYQRIPDAGDGE
jgi:hypothetical protein